MNTSNILEFSVPLEGAGSWLNFIHYCEDIETKKRTPFNFPEFTGIIINLSNTIEYTLGDSSYFIKSNQYQIVHTGPGKCLLNLHQGLQTVILLKFPADLLDSVANNIIFGDLLTAARTNSTYQLNVPLRIPYQIHGILDQMYRYNHETTQQAFIQIKVAEMIILFIDQILKAKTTIKTQDEFSTAINNARRLLINNLNKDWTLDLLSFETGISRKKLVLGFRKYFETSPICYLHNERLNKAVALLRETTLSVNEITAKVGYRHSQNFSQAFSKKFGHAPTAYRPL